LLPLTSKKPAAKKKARKASDKLEKALTAAQEQDEEDVSGKVLEHLPHLAAEMGQSETEVKIEGIRWEETNRTRQVKKPGAPRFSGHSPDIVDFLRRCNTDEEAMEIISFLEKRGEIKPVHAKELRKQLQSQGVRSFGSKKDWGYYEREE
jgi:hypothetical protein